MNITNINRANHLPTTWPIARKFTVVNNKADITENLSNIIQAEAVVGKDLIKALVTYKYDRKNDHKHTSLASGAEKFKEILKKIDDLDEVLCTNLANQLVHLATNTGFFLHRNLPTNLKNFLNSEDPTIKEAIEELSNEHKEFLQQSGVTINIKQVAQNKNWRNEEKNQQKEQDNKAFFKKTATLTSANFHQIQPRVVDNSKFNSEFVSPIAKYFRQEDAQLREKLTPDELKNLDNHLENPTEELSSALKDKIIANAKSVRKNNPFYQNIESQLKNPDNVYLKFGIESSKFNIKVKREVRAEASKNLETILNPQRIMEELAERPSGIPNYRGKQLPSLVEQQRRRLDNLENKIQHLKLDLSNLDMVEEKISNLRKTIENENPLYKSNISKKANIMESLIKLQLDIDSKRKGYSSWETAKLEDLPNNKYKVNDPILEESMQQEDNISIDGGMKV